jgi:pyridoxal biosynthesis lyase PdxS
MNMKSKLQTLRDLLYETETKKTVFSDQPAPLTTEDKRAFAESLKSFSQIGESVYGNRNLEEITERLSKMVETASRMVTEKEDVVDSVSASRHMKHVSAALNEFKKSAAEMMIHERRLAAAYEDIAEGLSKYYKVD